MPIYDYVCTRCDRVTEVIHGIHDAGPRFCPACGAEGTLRKGITTSAVHFKGSGWAKKDRSASAASGKARPAKPAGDAVPAGGESAGASDAPAGPSVPAPASTAAGDGGD